ncbi:MAG: GerMN domain-containing protein [Clostridia bacterium]|nr:GerMN domain-containing protein [Clostridia bacterium]
MRKLILLLTACLLAFCGCSSIPDDGSSEVISVYYLTSDESGKSLGYEVFTPDASLPVDGRIDEILRRMKNPMNENNRSLIPEGVEVKEVRVFGSTVVVSFGGEKLDLMDDLDRSLLSAGVTLSLSGVSEIGYVRVSDGRANPFFMNGDAILLDDEDLRLSVFELTVYTVDRENNTLEDQQISVISENDELDPQLVVSDMLDGRFGSAAPFEGRMDVRSISKPNERGVVRAEIFVPVEMGLKGYEADLHALVNSLCSCRGVEYVAVTINGRVPSERGIEGCDIPMAFNDTYLEETQFDQ